MGELGFCTLYDIFHEAGKQLTVDITSDSSVPLMIVRMLHNKVFYSLFFSLRCYMLYSDIRQIVTFIWLIAIPFVLYGLIGKQYRKFVLLIHILFPLFFIVNPLHLNLGERIHAFTVYYYLLAIVGAVKLVEDIVLRWKKTKRAAS